jgi:hypothetical protein
VKHWSGRCRKQDSITANRQYGKRDGKMARQPLKLRGSCLKSVMQVATPCDCVCLCAARVEGRVGAPGSSWMPKPEAGGQLNSASGGAHTADSPAAGLVEGYPVRVRKT